MFIGATTNAVNGLVSPVYFINILHWHNVENVWRACIAQGIFDGLLTGLFFSLDLHSRRRVFHWRPPAPIVSPPNISSASSAGRTPSGSSAD